MKFSKFGQKFAGDSGISDLMNDLGEALSTPGEKYMFGGGNPPLIPEVQRVYQKQLAEIAADPNSIAQSLSNYDTPKGNAKFIQTLCNYFNARQGWKVKPENIVITPGSQAGFFMLFNLLAGLREDGSTGKLLLPIVPEYIGYLDQALEPAAFVANQPEIQITKDHYFKYHVDFETLKLTDEIAAICLSRPTNPTGNVVSGSELEKLRKLAKSKDIPLIIDNAYGLPFPGIVRDQTPLIWNDDMIFSMSLSKIGLPATRVGIFIAKAEITQALTKINAILALANPNIGQLLIDPLIKTGQLDKLVKDVVRPFYFARAEAAKKILFKHFSADLPWFLHEHEGSFFFWLWLKDLPLTSKELYKKLKEQKVIVVPGEHYFTGVDKSWRHQHECLRLSIARDDQELEKGLKLLAETINTAYNTKI